MTATRRLLALSAAATALLLVAPPGAAGALIPEAESPTPAIPPAWCPAPGTWAVIMCCPPWQQLPREGAANWLAGCWLL